jgi:4-diphosphocytidyl-2-C-methyl-D-erythritol kinase
MSYGLSVKAPGKVNIGLQVLPKRSGDGFHGLVSIFQAVAMWNTLHITVDGAPKKRCVVHCSAGSLPEDNTLHRAYRGFAALTGIETGVVVDVDKGIPDGAGLGGASSDGAARIMALDALHGTGLSLAQKDRIAAEVGSDVFFFLRCTGETGGAAVVTGRGEVVAPISDPRRDLALVVVVPPVHSSTPEAFRRLDAFRWGGGATPVVQPEELLAMYRKPPEEWSFGNDFTASLLATYPLIGDALADLTVQGSVFASVTGSGSAVYGVFPTPQGAEKAAHELAEKWHHCVAVNAI